MIKTALEEVTAVHDYFDVSEDLPELPPNQDI